MKKNLYILILVILELFIIANSSPLNACLKNYAIPDIQVLSGFIGYGWDDLQSSTTKPIFKEEFHECTPVSNGRFLVPDNVHAEVIHGSSINDGAEFFSNYTEYKQVASHTFTTTTGAKLGWAGASAEFSKRNQEIKENFAKHNASMLRTFISFKALNLSMDHVGTLVPGFVSRIEQISLALSGNSTNKAKYLAEMVVRDYGTHYIQKATLGANAEEHTFITSDSLSANTENLKSVKAAFTARFRSNLNIEISNQDENSKKHVEIINNITKYHTRFQQGEFKFVNGTPILQTIVSLEQIGLQLYQVIDPKNFPNIPDTLVFEIQMLIVGAIDEYYRVNTIKGCTDINAPNFNFQANMDDKSCEPNNNTYSFGGIFQTCEPQPGSPGYRCDGFHQHNTFVGGQKCDESFEAKKVAEIIHEFETRVENHKEHKCDTFMWIPYGCRDHDNFKYFLDKVNVSIFQCQKKAGIDLLPEKGVMFGGIFEDGKVNVVTRNFGCPGTFKPYQMGTKSKICLSYDYSANFLDSFPLSGFFSCQSPERSCPEGYTQQFAFTENECDVYFCGRKQRITDLKPAALKHPPFTSPYEYITN